MLALKILVLKMRPLSNPWPSLGFHHEQVRPDRDGYVAVHLENVYSGYESQFNKVSEESWIDQNTNYDTGSVMQYGGYGFSANGNPTITYIENGVDTGTDVKIAHFCVSLKF